MFGDKRPSSTFLKRHTGYVEQFDTLVDTLTVVEMLMYTAELKRPGSEPYANKAKEVEYLVKNLGLERCRTVIIGNPLSRGISGGQAKRVNIGIAVSERACIPGWLACDWGWGRRALPRLAAILVVRAATVLWMGVMS